MSTVYLAEDTILNREVAIKAISIPQNEKEETMKRFERELTMRHNFHMKTLLKYMMFKKMKSASF